MKKLLKLTVNGEEQILASHQHFSLLEVLRYDMGLTGPNRGVTKGTVGHALYLLMGSLFLRVAPSLRHAKTGRSRPLKTWRALMALTPFSGPLMRVEPFSVDFASPA